MLIRTATQQDLAAMCAVDSIAAQQPQRSAQIAGWLAQYTCLVADEHGQVVAYAVMHRHFFGCAFIEMLMVAPARRRSGLAAALITRIQADCAGQKLFTSCNRSNAPVQRLLVQLGFVASGVIEHLDEGDPEQVYCWQA